jgi:hydrogenase maturation factor
VEWLSGIVEFYTNISPDQFITITEGQGITGVNEIKNDSDFQIFPNPAAGIITLKAGTNKWQPGDKIIVTNVLGDTEKEFRIAYETEKFEINLKSLKTKSNGILYFSIYSKSGLITRKIIKL